MIFLGIDKLVQSFQRPQIAQTHRASAKFVSLWKNLLVLIYSKLYSKSYIQSLTQEEMEFLAIVT